MIRSVEHHLDNPSARKLFAEYRKVIVDSLLEDFMGIHCSLGAGTFLPKKIN